MTQTQSDSPLSRWSVDDLPLTIEYSLAVIEEIRAAVVEGFYRIARGGVEVGGVLFGVRERELVRILAARPVACEYASGPSYLLSEKDLGGLRRLLETFESDPELAGLRPAGWYHSHTRSGIFLSERDLEIYNQYFPEPWQLSLILRPERLKPVRGGFFLRESDGSVRAHSSYREFTVEPLGKRKSTPARSAPEEQEEASGFSLPEPQPIAQRPRRLWIDWLLFAAAVCLALSAAGVLAANYLLRDSRPPPPFREPLPEARELLRQKDELTREVERLRVELEKQSTRNSELEAALKRLRAQSESGRKPNQ